MFVCLLFVCLLVGFQSCMSFEQKQWRGHGLVNPLVGTRAVVLILLGSVMSNSLSVCRQVLIKSLEEQ